MFTLGPLLITWHGFFSALGLASGIWLVGVLVYDTDLTADDVTTMAMPAVIGGIIGARLLFVLENLWLFVDRPLAIFAINEGGISIYGAVIGGSLVGWLYARSTRRSVPLLADRAAIGLMLGQGIGRIGDIINGEHHGTDAPDFPLSVTYTHPGTLGEFGVPVHLAVGYEMVYDLIVAFFLYQLLRRQPRDGITYIAYIFLYGLGRLAVGFYRKDTIVLSLGSINLGMAQTIGLISLIVAVPWLIWLMRQPPAEPSEASESQPAADGTRAERRRRRG